MKTRTPHVESLVLLSVDLASAKVLVWFASVGRDGELTPEAHSYFADRYHRLAETHRRRGRLSKAARLEAKAEIISTPRAAPTDRRTPPRWRCHGPGASSGPMPSALATAGRPTMRLELGEWLLQWNDVGLAGGAM